jgi:CheY-like chemotaxis protein
MQIKRTNLEYLKHSNIISVNKELDKLFKDFVYLPLIVESQNQLIVEKEKTNSIVFNISNLQNLAIGQMPASRLIFQIENKWNELKIATNPDKLNILYDLELLYNLLDQEESDQITYIQNASVKNSSLLLTIMFFLLLITLFLIMFALNYQKLELGKALNEKEKTLSYTRAISILAKNYFDSSQSLKPIFDKNSKPLIMVIDDNFTNLLIIQVILESLGAKVITANNGSEVFFKFSHQIIDMILIDCQTTVMDSFEVVRSFRDHNVLIPILAMSDTTTLEVQNKCHSFGMNDIISKPIEINILILLLKKSLDLGPSFNSSLISDQLASVQTGFAKPLDSFH